MEQRRNIYDYSSAWKKYAFDAEENRFLSDSEEDLLKICDVIDTNKKRFRKTSGGIPIHYEDGKIYVLKEGPHCLVDGESGSKKSRTVARGGLITPVLNGDSIIVTDPKMELASDKKIQNLLKLAGYNVHVMDFREFDKDGFNPFKYAFDLRKRGERSKSSAFVDNFVSALCPNVENQKDPYWDTEAMNFVRAIMQMLMVALDQLKGGEEACNLSSMKSFIRQDREEITDYMETIVKEATPNDGAHAYYDILQLPDRTYACITSSANALLSKFIRSEELMRMLSVHTFNIEDFYEKPSALFMVVPDDTSTYDRLVGFLLDQFYQILIENYERKYQNKCEPRCNIKFICDEAANVYIKDLASKISAARSRKIDWTLIYQSERQMAAAYEKDWPTVCGNCKHRIFLGSTDYTILKNISDQMGVTHITRDGHAEPIVSVGDLRKMRKEWEYKDALVISGNYLYTAKLPDYDTYDFLTDEGPDMIFRHKILENKPKIYTPKDMYNDFYNRRITFKDKDSAFGKLGGK